MKTVYSTARQLVQWIPEGLIGKLAHQFKLNIRKFSAVSHVVALLIGQLTGVGCLNHIVDMARVEVNGKLVEMEFITDNMEWSAWTVAELCRALENRDLLQGAQTDLPDIGLRGVQRKGRPMAGVDRPPGPPAAEIPGAHLEVGPELLPPRGCRTARTVGPPQHQRIARILLDGKCPIFLNFFYTCIL